MPAPQALGISRGSGLIIIVLIVVSFAAFFVWRTSGREGESKTSVDVNGLVKISVGLAPSARYIDERQVSDVNVDEFIVDSDHGYIVPQAFSDEWTQEDLGYRRLIEERGTQSAIAETFGSDPQEVEQFIAELDEQVDVRRIRRGELYEMETTSSTALQGVLVGAGYSERAYDQIIIMTFPKGPDSTTLLDFFLQSTAFASQLGPKRLATDDENKSFLLHSAAKLDDLDVDGTMGTYWLTNMLLAQENDGYFILAVVNHLSGSEKDPDILRELERYLDSLRVIEPA